MSHLRQPLTCFSAGKRERESFPLSIGGKLWSPLFASITS
jgi:hypothetical protein